MIKKRITVGDGDKYVTLDVQQHVDVIEVLSMKLLSSDFYKIDSANYGVLVGRVTTNGGFGIANANVSIFIPVDEDEDENIRTLYPYESTYDKKNGVRYNLLPAEKKGVCHVPVGTFPSKNELVDNETLLAVHQKYFKYTTKTNSAGDYMIVGVPIGTQFVHMDVDLSDIGFVSIRPYDFINQGYSKNQFESNNKFKSSKDLDSLPHIQKIDTSVDIKRFWGEKNQNVGITVLNFDLPIDVTPTAIFFGGLYTDSGAGRITKKCRPRVKMGRNCNLSPSSGNIDAIRKISDRIGDVEQISINGDIDQDGNWVSIIPMNLSKMITDEKGNLIPSSDPNRGIPTRAKMRFRVNSQFYNYKFFSGLSRTGSFLIPNMYNRYHFGSDTHEDDFFELKWKKIYTVSQYIPRLDKRKNDDGENFTGIKRIDECDNNTPFPFNRVDVNVNPIYTLFSVFSFIVYKIADLLDGIPNVNVTLPCNGEDLDPDEWLPCIRQYLAEYLGAVRYEFYNDWVNGSLYAPLFMYKTKFNNGKQKWEKYCDFDCREKSNSTQKDLNYKNKCAPMKVIERSTFMDIGDNPIAEADRGIILKQDGYFYYASRFDLNKNPIISKNLSVEQKRYLMFATNVVELGSSVSCDVDSVPYIIKNLQSTTYNENEDPDTLFNVESATPTNVNRNAVQLSNQIDTEQLSEFYDNVLVGNFENLPEYDSNTNKKTKAIAFDRSNETIRKYLCENFNYYNNAFTYQSAVNNNSDPSYFLDVDDDGSSELADFVYDNCVGCDDKNSPHKKMHNYYFYFGVSKGKNAFDKLLKEYFSDCE